MSKRSVGRPGVIALGTLLAIGSGVVQGSVFRADDLAGALVVAGEPKASEGRCGEGKCGEGRCGHAAPAAGGAESAAAPQGDKAGESRGRKGASSDAPKKEAATKP